MVFRYPHPPAVAVGEVCALSNKDIAETSSGTITKEDEEKLQREEIAQEVTARMVRAPRASAHSPLLLQNADATRARNAVPSPNPCLRHRFRILAKIPNSSTTIRKRRGMRWRE